MKKGYNQHKETAGEIESSEGDDRTYTFASQWHKGRPVEQKTKGGNMLATYRLLPIFHLGSPRKTDPTKCHVSFGKLRKNIFRGTWWGPFYTLWRGQAKWQIAIVFAK